MKLFLFFLPFISSISALSGRTAEAAPCTCEPVFCNQSWPYSCYCANGAKKAVYEKCCVYIPVYAKCPLPSGAAPAPAPAPTPLPVIELTKPPPSCVCEQVLCIQAWPDSCHCENNAKKACFAKCGGKEPIYQICPPPAPGLAAPSDPVTESNLPTECKCSQVNCTMKWPEGCYCSNFAKELCYKECGGEKPVLNVRYISSLLFFGKKDNLTCSVSLIQLKRSSTQFM